MNFNPGDRVRVTESGLRFYCLDHLDVELLGTVVERPANSPVGYLYVDLDENEEYFGDEDPNPFDAAELEAA